jgi:hypothetical protein
LSNFGNGNQESGSCAFLELVALGVTMDSSDAHPVIPISSHSEGELIDTGGNFNMTNRLDILVNVIRIKPFTIGMAAKEDKSTSVCTHCGNFPIPMLDESIFYTPVYYNEHASDLILSPEAICYASGGLRLAHEMVTVWLFR